jgi:exonuclease VII small subunit
VIEQSIEVLESGELGLEESLARYEAGLKAMQHDEKPADA